MARPLTAPLESQESTPATRHPDRAVCRALLIPITAEETTLQGKLTWRTAGEQADTCPHQVRHPLPTTPTLKRDHTHLTIARAENRPGRPVTAGPKQTMRLSAFSEAYPLPQQGRGKVFEIVEGLGSMVSQVQSIHRRAWGI